jgi:hypothetical protein
VVLVYFDMTGGRVDELVSVIRVSNTQIPHLVPQCCRESCSAAHRSNRVQGPISLRVFLVDKGCGGGSGVERAASQVGVAMHTSAHAQRRRRTMSRYSTDHQICAMRLVAVRVTISVYSVLSEEPAGDPPWAMVHACHGLVTPVGLAWGWSWSSPWAGARDVRCGLPERRSVPRAGNCIRGLKASSYPTAFSYRRSCSCSCSCRSGCRYGVDCLLL